MSRFLYQLTLPLSQHVLVVLSRVRQCVFVYTFPDKVTMLKCNPKHFEGLTHWDSNSSGNQGSVLELADENQTPHNPFMEKHRVWGMGLANDTERPDAEEAECLIYWITEIQHQEALDYLATRGLQEMMEIPPDGAVEQLLWILALIGEPKIVTGEEPFNVKPDRVKEIV